MANTYGYYNTLNTEGINYKETYPAASNTPYVAPPPFALGQSSLSTDNATWVFVRATNALNTTANNVAVDANFLATAGAGNYTALVAFAAGESGWVRKSVTPPL